MRELPVPDMALVLGALEILSTALLFVIGLGIVAVMVLYIIDITQTHHAVRRNYPVIGRFRYVFEHLGEFFRQYFFAMDREEMPFNRAQRSWIYRASKNVKNTIAFGSTRDLTHPGSVLFINDSYPELAEEASPPKTSVIGARCALPYETEHFFHISAMSFGALSEVAVRALSTGAQKAGCWLNTGEGGLAPEHLSGGCDVVFQIGTAKYGVRDLQGQLSDQRLKEVAEHKQVRMFEIKLSQGAKPGSGGILPAAKVTPKIAKIRGIPVGEASLSPHRHTDIHSAADLLKMMAHIRDLTGRPVGFKSVIGHQRALDEWFEEVVRMGPDFAPDFITVDGCDGGTGAAPMPLMDSVGLPLRESLPMVCDSLTRYGLRDRVHVIASGKLVNPTDVAWALCLGADFVNSARSFMFALGCIQALQCNKNTCPTGVTTHNPRLQLGLNPADKSERVAYLARNMEKEVRLLAHSCGLSHPQELSRQHARIVQPNGLSIPLDELYPVPQPLRPA